jgi:VWFA-related protein
VDLTLVDIQVLDATAGRPVTDLRKSDFIVTEDGYIRDVAVFEAENVPLDLALVLDSTGVQETVRIAGQIVGRPDPVADGMVRMLAGVSPQDRLAVVSFSSSPRLHTGLTSDAGRLRNALERAMEDRARIRERTAAVYEAIEFAAAVFGDAGRIGRRRAVFVVTHNRDSEGDPSRLVDALRALSESDAALTALVVEQSIYLPHLHAAIGVLGRERAAWPPKGHEETEVLVELNSVDPLVEATAGEIFRDASDAFWNTALDRMRNRYRLGFYDDGGEDEPGRIEVSLAPEARRRWPGAVVRVPKRLAAVAP